MNPAFLDAMSWEMAEVYGAITDQILINLAHYFPFYQFDADVPRSSFTYQAKMLAQMGQVNAQTMRIIRNGLQGADSALQGVLEQAIVDAVRVAEPDLVKGVKAGIFSMPTTPVVSPNQMRAFQLYYHQAAEKMNMVNTVMLESTQSAYRQAVSDVVSQIDLADRMNRTQIALDTAAGETLTGVSSWNQALRHATDQLKSGGIVGFIDHAGHKWSAEAYVAMDIRTTVFNTGRSAVWETNQNFGNDLYSVSYHDGARPLCYPWQNKVISSLDAARTTFDLDGNPVQVIAQSSTSYGAPAGLFGINCKHYPTPFIPGVSVIEGQPQNKEDNDRVYAESQEQRRLERKLREEKRDLMMAKAQGASPEELEALRERCRKSSADIDEFCKETGRARHKDREAVYTKREFPDKEKYDVSKFERDQKKLIDDYYKNGGTQQGYTFGQMTPNTPPPTPPTPPTPPATPATVAPPVMPEAKATNPLVTDVLPKSGIKPLDVKRLETPRTTDEIISVLSGGDATKGSCSSLAYAYAGQRAGYDVIDFRGGASQEFFSRQWLKITNFDGVDGQVAKAYNDFVGSHLLFKQVEVGKEYYFSTGRHAAIIRKTAGGSLEYLELQSATRSGWKTLDDNALRYRFAAKKQHTTYGMKYQCSSTLVDVEKFGQSADFVEMLKYINTEADKQKKGVLGGIK